MNQSNNILLPFHKPLIQSLDIYEKLHEEVRPYASSEQFVHHVVLAYIFSFLFAAFHLQAKKIKVYQDYKTYVQDILPENLFTQYLHLDLKIDQNTLAILQNFVMKISNQYDLTLISKIYETVLNLAWIRKNSDKQTHLHFQEENSFNLDILVHSRNALHKKNTGVYYTNTETSNMMVNIAFQDTVQYPKIIDPAVGCGNFLLAAYNRLTQKSTLSPEEIVQQCLYGVDIDPIAVELSRLTFWTLSSWYPKKNILVGNSLMTEFMPTNQLYISWNEFFQDVFDQGGFDIALCNPPYLNIQKIHKYEKQFYLQRYHTAYRRFDLYVLFVELALTTLLKENGKLVFITPDKILRESYGKVLRKLVLDHCNIHGLYTVDQAFNDTTINVRPVIFNLSKSRLSQNLVTIGHFESGKNSVLLMDTHNQDNFYANPNYGFKTSIDKVDHQFIEKMQHDSVPLHHFCYISWGAQPGQTSKFIKKIVPPEEETYAKPLIRGANISRYSILFAQEKLIYKTEGPNKLHRPAFPELFESNKIVIPEVSKKLVAAFDNQKFYTNHSVINCIMKDVLIDVHPIVCRRRGIKIDLTNETIYHQFTRSAKSYTKASLVNKTHVQSAYDLFYILACLNSKLVGHYFNSVLNNHLNIFPEAIKYTPVLWLGNIKANETFQQQREKFIQQIKFSYDKKRIEEDCFLFLQEDKLHAIWILSALGECLTEHYDQYLDQLIDRILCMVYEIEEKIF